MKKSYLFLSAFLVGSAFAQVATEDFSTDPFANGWTVQGDDAAIYGAAWARDTDGPTGCYVLKTERVNSLTRDNGVLMLDLDGYKNNCNIYNDTRVNVEAVSPAFDVSVGTDNGVLLTFYHSYNFWFSGGLANNIRVEVSDDDFATFTAYDLTKPGYLWNLEINERVILDVTNAIDPLKKDNVRLRFAWGQRNSPTTNPDNYYWQIDDIIFYDQSPYLAKIDTANATYSQFGPNKNYGQIPKIMAGDIQQSFYGRISNIGPDPLTGAKFSIFENGNAWGVTTSEDVASGNTSNFLSVTGNYPSSVGVYNYHTYVSSNEQIAINDTAKWTVEITKDKLSAGKSTTAGFLLWQYDLSHPATRDELGYGGEVYIPGGYRVEGLYVGIPNQSANETQTITIELYDTDAGFETTSTVLKTMTYDIQPSDLGTIVEILFDTPFVLDAANYPDGKYIAYTVSGPKEMYFYRAGSYQKENLYGRVIAKEAGVLKEVYLWDPALISLKVDNVVDYEARKENTSFGIGYGKKGFGLIPTTIVADQPLYFEGVANNLGSLDLTNVKFDITQDGGTWASTNVAATLASGAKSAKLQASANVSSTLGVHNYEAIIKATETLAKSDTLRFSVETTADEYSAGTNDYYGLFDPLDFPWINTPTTVGVGGSVIVPAGYRVEGMYLDVYDTLLNDAKNMKIKLFDGSNGNIGNNAVVLAEKSFVSVTKTGVINKMYVAFDAPFNVKAADYPNGLQIDYYVVAEPEFIFTKGGNSFIHNGRVLGFDANGKPSENLADQQPARAGLKIGVVGVSTDENDALNNNTLKQNVPNPFNANTVINYSLTSNQRVSFEVVDVTGKLVKTMNLGSQGAGNHQIQLNASEFNKGIYFYTLTTGDVRMTKKMVVNK